MAENNRQVGQWYEDKAAQYLIQMGYRILERNFRCRLGEIDIIGQEGDQMVFIEVKYRKNNKKGDPSEAVHYYKQRTITKVAQHYLLRKGFGYYTPCRFDVVIILDNKIRIIKNAFSAIG